MLAGAGELVGLDDPVVGVVELPVDVEDPPESEDPDDDEDDSDDFAGLLLPPAVSLDVVVERLSLR